MADHFHGIDDLYEPALREQQNGHDRPPWDVR
jgi:hypothetical protein